MKLVTWHEFIQMPEGTVFSEMRPNSLVSHNLRMKGETWFSKGSGNYHDYLETDLMPNIRDVSYAGYDETVGSEIMVMHPSHWGRDGMFDQDRKYWIWEREDRERLARWLLNPEAVAASEELNADNVRWHGKYDDLEVKA